MSTKTLNLTPSVYDYMLKHSLRESSVLKALRDETATMTGAVMQISPEQGQFMSLLIEILGARKTLDIGTFTGYSALVVAQALPENGKVIACDVSAESTTVAKKYWQQANVANKIDLHIAPALETLQKLLDNHEAGTYDFAFIDADKRNYLEYYEKALTLLRPGGVIAIDNVLWSGKVADHHEQGDDTNAIRAVNTKLVHDNRVTISMVPIGDGLTLARKH